MNSTFQQAGSHILYRLGEHVGSLTIANAISIRDQMDRRANGDCGSLVVDGKQVPVQFLEFLRLKGELAIAIRCAVRWQEGGDFRVAMLRKEKA